MATARETLDELDEEERRRLSGGGMADEPDAAMELPEADLGRQTSDDYGRDEGPEYRPAELAGEPPPTPEPEPASDPSDWRDLPKPGATIAQALAGKKSDGADEMRRIASKRYVPSAAVGDEAIAKAKADRKQQTQWNDLSRAMTAWAFRKPFEPTPPGDDAADLSQQRAREESSFERDKSLQLALAKALRGEKAAPTPGALSEYQKYQIDRDARQAAEKKAADEKKAGDDAATLEAARKQWAPLLRKEGLDPNVATQKDIDRVLSKYGSDSRLALANAEFGYRKSEDEKKEAKAAAQDIPPGFRVADGAEPSPESRKKFTQLVASQRKMKELTAAMRRELKGVGVLDRMLPGEKRRRLQQLATQMRIEAKNVAELGAISGPDMALMETMATDPTSVGSLAGGSMESNLAGLDSWGDASVRAGSKAYGIVPDGGGATTTKMRFPDGSTDDVAAADMDLARRKGGVPAP